MALFKKKLKGIHVEHRKNTMDMETEVMPTPDTVYISMSQHIGAPCKPLVQVGDEVKVGQKIGDTDAYVSAPVHSSVSGKVTGIEDMMSILGSKDPMIIIKTDKKQSVHESVKPPVINSREDFIKSIRESGLVGLGGAAFPTSVKYSPSNLDEVDTLIINGAECEPYITSDYRTIIEDSGDIIDGIRYVMKYLDIPKCYIGIEDNKPAAISILNKEIENDPAIEIVTMKAEYPKGAERVLIYETCERVLPPGKLPADIGVLVSNITSVAFLASYMRTGMPLISKRLTVDGLAVADPKNILAPIGVKIYEIIDFCGGYQDKPRKVLMGGPMMGRTIYDDGKPMIKNNNAILVFGKRVVDAYQPETQCINCGRCVNSCPLDLLPKIIMTAFERRDVDRLKKLRVDICMECGCCSYVCPAKRQLSLTNRLAKMIVKEAEENAG